MFALKKLLRYARWPLAVMLVIYLGFVLAEVNWPVSKAKSDAAVAAIQAQRLTMKDVDGTNLPPAPDPAKVDATVEGIDANANGIRDDVELAIFDKYPNDIQARTAAMEYALALQMYLTRVIDTKTWVAATEKMSNAQTCVFSVYPRNPGARTNLETFVREQTLDNVRRGQAHSRADEFTTSFTVPDEYGCMVSPV